MNVRALLFLCASLSIFSVIYCAENSVQEEAIAEVAKNYPLATRPEFSTFALLIKKANLVNFFQGTGPFTIFVPSNSAFEKMDKTTFEEIQKPENMGKLIDFINYHVIMGKYPSTNLKSKSYRTVNGKEINVKNENGEISVNGIKVTKADLEGPNGVCYVIDSVLMP